VTVGQSMLESQDERHCTHRFELLQFRGILGEEGGRQAEHLLGGTGSDDGLVLDNARR